MLHTDNIYLTGRCVCDVRWTRLPRALESRRSDFAEESIDLDLWSREAFLRTVDDQGNRYTIPISIVFSHVGFYVSVQGAAIPSGHPEIYQILITEEILAFLYL